jgi:hypothetical protein
MEECLGSSTEQTKKNTFGYIAAINKQDVTVFAVSKGDAVEKMIEFANSGRSRLITLVYKLMKAIPRRLPSNIIRNDCKELVQRIPSPQATGDEKSVYGNTKFAEKSNHKISEYRRLFQRVYKTIHYSLLLRGIYTNDITN